MENQIVPWSAFKESPMTKQWWTFLPDSKKPLFKAECTIETSFDAVAARTPNATLRSWARKNMRGKFCRRERPGRVMIFFFSKAEDAILFKLQWVD